MAKRVLVVDDDPDTVEALQGLIEIDGYDVDTAKHGLEALQKLSASTYDGMILGIRMPVMGGLEALKQLRRNGATIPVIMMTGSALSELETQQIESEAQGFLSKPFSQPDLSSLLVRLVGPPN